MKPYHGLPVWPATAAAKVTRGRHVFVSLAHPEQTEIALELSQSFALDNGAFSAWMSGKPVSDWSDYYRWVAELHRHPGFDFAVIPDVIDGDEEDNDALIEEWPWIVEPRTLSIGAPVWHMHESIHRLLRLARTWPRICIGSSGQYATVGSPRWWVRIAEAMNAVCDKDGQPICKLHGLRMLNPDVFSRLPLASADSTNVAQNIGIDSAWRGSYQPPTKDWRALILAERIESHNSASIWEQTPIQGCLLSEAAP